MHVLKRAGGAVAVVAAAAVSVALAAPANADTGAQAGDVVIVGSDTVQNAINFVLDGSPGVAGGYNTNGNLNRAVAFDATGDANGRAVYDGTCGVVDTVTGQPNLCGTSRTVTDGVTNSTTTLTSATAGFTNFDKGAIVVGAGIPVGDTIASVTNATTVVLATAETATASAVTVQIVATGAPELEPGSVVLRSGTKPVTRPNGSGAGVGALIADATGGTGFHGLPAGSIQIARMSRLPKSSEETSCPTTGGCGGLHVYQIASDGFTMVHQASAYNGPASLSLQELLGIYTCNASFARWNQLAGNSGGSANTIHPLAPQSGSGTLGAFQADLASVNGGVTPTFGPCVRTVEEHDPTGVYTDPSQADAIEPFSQGKLSLINGGYFAQGVGYSGTGFANGAYTPSYLATTTAGTAGDGNPNWSTSRFVYITIRNPDLSSGTPFQPGSPQNWATALITSAFGAIQSSTGKSEIAAAGFTYNFKDCGINPTAC